ncbi:hypothetical protein IMG5_178920 [Ichthyophthirius multifiliis]|uniref:Adenylate kinase active site lid domain-containing protein n=1 Tax=Ichthyophthirius multifiliis TaxID=5932 RepID=G0R2K0_ICHMU|nr:hypothetical protein IMG5_178920 [Ichthyophthirius multifiliis]EGR28312.1 hypothetical protein IMG5_178920 [Ichthyophthirius multifiliis]|eukprot:XP_004027657.1 hypothetical protein IMG5_178920 [Ichthyophthirius multifiliis]
MFKSSICKISQLHSTQIYFFGQKFLFLFGAPGVGKGTYAKFLKKDLKLNHISTGDEIRKILKGQAASTFSPALKNEIKSIVESGKLVNDDIVINIIKEKLKEPESTNGVILDGFPRTVSQLQKYDAQKLPVHLVVNLTLNQSVLLEKLMGRRVCNGCGNTYNYCSINRDGYEMEPLLPKKEGTCDKCGSKDIVTRADDSKDIISARMQEYELKTSPVLKEFQKRQKTWDFEAKKGVNDYQNFLKELKPRLDKI